VDKQQTPEEKLKTAVYDIYTSLFYETASDRRQVYIGQIWEKIVLWCNRYLKINANEMGVEIFSVIKRLVKDDNEPVKNKSEFINILKKSMKNAENEYFRTFGQGSIHIPKEERRMLKELNKIIRIKEDQLQRELSDVEKEQCVSKWFKKQEYIDLLNVTKVKRLSDLNKDENNENGDLDVADPHSNGSPDEDYAYDSLDNSNTEAVIEAVKSVLDKKQERSRDCYRALFTLHCIENIKDFEEFTPVLDKSILEACQKDSENPSQYEIYQKHHPNTQKSSAEAMASRNLSEFLNDIKPA